MELEASQAYANFRAWVPRKQVCIGVLHPITWRYYDWGPRNFLEPVICLHSLIGSAESFFHQLIYLPPRGYRVISLQVPVYWTVAEFCDAFHAFLETIPHRRVHLYGAGLGGFLAMHYAVRKPENVASLALTHSFLSTENLNIRVPYSPSVLRWLPDFLVRATMRAILPKGKVSLEMANAAEFAIGSTMQCSREMLASRLALSTTDSSVLNRVHIPQTSITLIDALDRQPLALQLSELTASHLPEARRAHLKSGGDFPYLAASEDVNMHLFVHLRRNAVAPVLDIAVPVPARPRMSSSLIKRRRESENHKRSNEASNKERNKSRSKNKTARKSNEDLQKEAKALVIADEKSRVERFAFEIGRLREFLPERDDAYLAAVLEECNGLLEVAIANARAEMYDDRFYDAVVSMAMADKLRQLEEAETAESNEYSEDEGTETSGDTKNANPEEEISGVAAGEGMRPSAYNESNDGEGSLSFEQTFASTEHHEENDQNAEQRHSAVDDDYTNIDDNISVVRSTGRSSHRENSDSMNVKDGDSLIGQMDRDGVSALSSIDLSGNEMHENTEMQNDETIETDTSLTSQKRDSGASRRQRRGRRRSYVEEEDALDAYVTSEKVGMRSSGPLIGRGPAPFNNPLVEAGVSPGDVWKRIALTREEEDSSKKDPMLQVSLTSGASLLEATENPLGLPGHDSSYTSERGQHSRDPMRTTSSLNTSPLQSRYSQNISNGNSRVSSIASPPQQGEGYSRDTGAVETNEDSTGELSALGQVPGAGRKERDEWESFRKRGRGLATAIPTPPKRESVRKSVDTSKIHSEANLEGTEGLESESEESARLREWRMSAQAASKNVQR